MNNWEFERTLRTGQLVRASFMNCGRVYHVLGRIVGRTKNYWKVRATEKVYGDAQNNRVFQIVEEAN